MSEDLTPELPRDEKVDAVRLFMLYTLFGGDARRVATVSRIPVATVESLAHDFRWKDKIITRGLDTDEGADEERALNRATNYVTADRLKRVFARLIDELDSDPSFARAFCTSVDRESGDKSFNTKNLVELAKGLQICNDITYRALQDRQAQAADVLNKSSDVASLAMDTYKALVGRFDRSVVVDTSLELLKATADVRQASETRAIE